MVRPPAPGAAISGLNTPPVTIWRFAQDAGTLDYRVTDGAGGDRVLEAFQGRLGLRPASESNADAVVRGRVVRYEPDIPLSFLAGQGRTDVTRRQVQITVDVEILDQRAGKTLWQRQGLSEVGEYQPPQEAAGRKVALQKLVNDIVDGAQSQW